MSREFNQDISQLTSKMVQCFLKDDVYNELTSPFLPNRKEIIEIISDIRRLFYPRHYGSRELYNCTISYYIGDLLLQIEERLSKQIGKALMREEKATSFSVSQATADRAAQISCTFMERLPWIRSMLAKDVEAAYEGDPAAGNKDEIILSYPGIFAIMVYRIAHELRILGVPVIPRMMTEYAHSRTGVDINPGAEIGEYFFIDHATGIVIGETTNIMDHVKVYQGVTLGALSTDGGQSLHGVKRHPTIERDVTIYANATILGGDTIIGEGAVIGGSCFITKSVPAHSTVQTVSKIKMRQFDPSLEIME
ncbi:MAG: serine O-acetyltransferase [Eubacteriaceae bacterium]|jgi:serine O-acetyltransferase